jgi:3-phosphoshikimate 1-carboxyvinyltransferase
MSEPSAEAASVHTSYGTGPEALTPIPPGRPLRGRAVPPGSKSITNRALLVAALAKGESRLTGALKSVDTELMAAALRQMGVSVGEPDETGFVVRGEGRLLAPATPLFLGNAGTATRFLTAAAASVEGTVVIDGDAHMRARPIAPLIEALRSLGVDAEAATGCPPVTIRGKGHLGEGRIEIDASLSSQYVSALLMAAPLGSGAIEIALSGTGIGARGYVDLTLAVMRAFGAEARPTGDGTWQVQPTGYRPADFAVEPDASAATYLWAAAALTGGDIDLGTAAADFTQPDARAHDVIAAFPDLPDVIEGSQMQDAVPTLAVLAAFASGRVRFTGIANLRVKECDRIAALANGLNAIAPGLAAEEGDDLVVDPAALANGARTARIETHDDHRIAMSFALAGLKLPGITIVNPACAAKTFPAYWETLAGLGVAYEDEPAAA